MRRIAAVLLTSALVGCGVPQQDMPRALDRDDAPFRVFDSEVAPAPQGDLSIELWFVLDEQPVPVERSVEGPGSPRQVLDQLLEGPTEAELAEGYSSAIPQLELQEVTVEEQVAVVTFVALTEQVQVEAYAQIVATLDGRPDIVGVRFRTDAGDVPVPDGEGVFSPGAVSQDDYAELLGLSPTPTPTAEPPQATRPTPTPAAS